MYRKKYCRITFDVLEEALTKVRKTFETSKAPKRLKKLLRRLPIIFKMCNFPQSKDCGMAIAIGERCRHRASRRYKSFRKNKPGIRIDDEIYYLFIEINQGSLKRLTFRGLRYIIAHELAHIVQIVDDKEVEGHMSYSTPSDHDKKWGRMCKWMGGIDSPWIERLWV